MKSMLVALMLTLAVGVANAYQNFTTPDGAFSGALLDGQITTTDTRVNGKGYIRWQTFENSSFSVALLESFDPDATAREDLEAAVNACRNTAGCTVLTDNKGTYNGFEGLQYSFTIPSNNGTLVLSTARVWESRTGHTCYGVAVYELPANHDQSRVESYLNAAVLPK